MGCANSKGDDLPLVSLCRERRDLIRAASDRRYALAAAHASYFDSLSRVGDALHRFVTEELTEVSSPSSSPLITLPPSDGKSKSVKSDGSNGNSNGNVDSGHISLSSSTISVSSSSACSDCAHLHLPEENAADSHSHFASGSEPERGFDQESSYAAYPPPQYSSFLNPNYYIDPVTGRYDYRHSHQQVDGGQFSSYSNPNYYSDPRFPVDRSQFSASYQNPNYYYMRKSSTTPSTFYVDPDTGGYVYTNGYYYNDRNPMMNEERTNVDESTANRPVPPPPPPGPEGSGWDFLNVFDTYEQFLMNVSRRRYGSGSSSSPNSSEIREKEGIPDLEEETEPESFREREKMKVMKNNVVDSRSGSSKTLPLEEVVVEGKASGVMNEKGGEEMRSSRKEVEEEEMFVRKKVSFEEHDSMRTTEESRSGRSGSSLVTEESRSGSSLVTEESRMGSSLVTEESGSSDGIALHDLGNKDVMEAMEEIKQQFKMAAGCGEVLSRLLEVGKRRYRSRNSLLKVIVYRILDSMALSSFIPLSPSSNPAQLPDATTLKVNEAMNSDYINVKSKNLSATLEKLYLWEKRLYKLVKDEEKLRVIYEKECRRLKALDEGGAESYKIDSTRAAIKELLTKINIAIRSVDVISRQIHEVRDKELRPQLTELIQGLIVMWKSVLACHQKQFLAISESKTHNLTVRRKIQSNSVAKATMSLELELLNWSSCFRNWISSQKAYIDALNGWLTKWLLEEQEETPDGFVPFSPGRIGAPAVFIVANDWHHAVERIAEVEVTSSIQLFAENVHRLWESQDEEHRQKLKAEYLSRDFSKRLRSLQKENGFLDASTRKRPVPVSNGDDHIVIALDTMKKILDEERAKHQEIMKHIQETTSNSLQMGLVPIFEALGNYTSGTLKAYEGLRIPSDNDEGI